MGEKRTIYFVIALPQEIEAHNAGIAGFFDEN